MHPDPQPIGSRSVHGRFQNGRNAHSRVAYNRIASGRSGSRRTRQSPNGPRRTGPSGITQRGSKPSRTKISGAIRWWIRLLGRSTLLLPLSLAGLIVALVGRRQTAAHLLRLWQEPPPAASAASEKLSEPSEEQSAPSVAPLLWTLVLLVPLGAVSLLIALLSTLNEIRVVLLYWLTDGNSISATTWGGPTLAGAWALHAVLGILLFPVFTAVLAGIDLLARRLADRPKSRNPLPRWVLPTAILADFISFAFLVAFTRQL